MGFTVVEYYFLTAAAAAALVIAAGALLLNRLRDYGCRQIIREEGPQTHHVKAGTPTMGGLFFLPPALFVGLVASGVNKPVLILAGMSLAFLLLGFADDFLMLKRKNNMGFKARHKLMGQFLLAGLFLLLFNSTGNLENVLELPFPPYLTALPAWIFYPIAMLLIVGTSNATNLTDGMDGLLAGLMTIAAAAFAVISHWLGRPDLAFFASALAGGCMGFLFYNRHPAKVFMGDTGSLALGAALAGMAILLGKVLLLFFFGAIFFIETLSVVMQVISFKSTGKRIFKMSPLHNHFELSGWKEVQVVRTFWAAAAAITIIALVGTHLGWRLG